MTPGVGLFYAGLVRSKNALTLITVCFLCSAVVGCQWFLFGFSLAFSETGGGFIGNFDHGGLTGIGMNSLSLTAPSVPSVVFVLYQLMYFNVSSNL
jgi:Amt family ammonium transporter